MKYFEDVLLRCFEVVKLSEAPPRLDRDVKSALAFFAHLGPAPISVADGGGGLGAVIASQASVCPGQCVQDRAAVQRGNNHCGFYAEITII